MTTTIDFARLTLAATIQTSSSYRSYHSLGNTSGLESSTATVTIR